MNFYYMKFHLLLALLSIVSALNAQNLNFNFSEEILLRKHDEYQGLVHSDTSGYIIHLYERSGKGLLQHPGRK